MPAFIDRTGVRYSRLTVVGRAPSLTRRTLWLCQCDCGGQRIVDGDNLRMGRTKSCGCLASEVEPIAARFWANVDKNGPIHPILGTRCWLWTASTTSSGYGQITKGAKGDGCHRTHRLSWELHHGPIPDGLWVLHHCDNPPCCNPAHLFLGTHADNVADREEKGRGQRYNAEKTHCRHGHEFSPENTYHFKGHRRCRECCRRSDARQRLRAKQA